MDKKEFLHNHPEMEKKLNLDPECVIVDRDEWEKAHKYYNIPGRIMKESVTLRSEPKPKKRYFIVCAAGDKTNFIFGVVTEGSYVSFENIDSAYRKSFKGSKMIVTPTNIIELNESDYNDWIK